MSDAHKASLAKGREQARAVRRYLEWLESSAPRRGRKRDASPERIEELEGQLPDANPIQRLSLVQTIRDLEAEAAEDADPREAERVRRDFVRRAKAYGTAKHIHYATWREAGVPADVLREAGITRGG